MKKLYIANMSAVKYTYFQTSVEARFCIAEAENKHEATGIILDECKTIYKEEDGYTNQRISDVCELETILPGKWYLLGEKK